MKKPPSQFFMIRGYEIICGKSIACMALVQQASRRYLPMSIPARKKDNKVPIDPALEPINWHVNENTIVKTQTINTRSKSSSVLSSQLSLKPSAANEKLAIAQIKMVKTLVVN